MDWQLRKYPRTRHIETSRPGIGDSADHVPFRELAGAHLVVEEKLDGANCAISFDRNGRLRLQSRGHELVGSPRERHFGTFKAWAAAHADALWKALGARYVCYGENLWAKHTVFYDALPHYFFEFDVYDTETGLWLDTPSRHDLLAGTGVVHVPVVGQGQFRRLSELTALAGGSLYATGQVRDRLIEAAAAAGVSVDVALRESDTSGRSEGLYVKHERNGQVVARYKWVRGDFVQAMLESGSHWQDRPLIANRLAAGADIWAVP